MLIALLISALFLLFCPQGFAAPYRIEGSSQTATAKAPEIHDQRQRSITVADAIRMTSVGDPSYYAGGPSKGLVAKFSRDGKRFVVVLRKGNLEHNTNDYSLILFNAADVLHSPVPKILVTLSSSSNRPAIFNIAWLEDNETILFLGEHPGEQTQLYSIKCSSGILERLTNHRTNLTSFVAVGNGSRIAYLAEAASTSFVTEQTLRHGFHITHELLSDLTKGGTGEIPAYQLFIKDPAMPEGKKLAIDGEIEFANAYLSLSPNGGYLVIQTEARQIPGIWTQYEDRYLQVLMHHLPSWGRTRILRYELVNTRTGASQPLIDAPIGAEASEAVWSPDSKSVIVSDVYLPLSIDNTAEQMRRKSHVFLVEVMIPSQDLAVVSDEDVRLLYWNDKTNQIICDLGRLDSLTGKPARRLSFIKNGRVWIQANAETTINDRPEIVLKESLQNAPRIVVRDSANGQESLLMDLNPQLESLALGKVEEVKWKDTLGRQVRGGLYWPLDYVEGHRYPLVIQTHGFNPDRFWVDGPWTTAFAALPLAGKGFFVIQLPDPEPGVWATPEEAPRAMEIYESAIDYLERRGLIDRSRIGIIGFSRTCLYVTYTLTHAPDKFAAASIADGIDGGYFGYMAFANSYPTIANEFDAFIGAPPFGEGLSFWMKNSPAFLMDKVRAPLLIQAIGPTSLLLNWDWFSGMSRLGKPVDMIYLPGGTHVLEKPWERMLSQQSDVDWFCFWLKKEEDEDPTKAGEYTRWRELRDESLKLPPQATQR